MPGEARSSEGYRELRRFSRGELVGRGGHYVWFAELSVGDRVVKGLVYDLHDQLTAVRTLHISICLPSANLTNSTLHPDDLNQIT